MFFYHGQPKAKLWWWKHFLGLLSPVSVFHLSLPMARLILRMERTSVELSTLPCSPIATLGHPRPLPGQPSDSWSWCPQSRTLSSTRAEQGPVLRSSSPQLGLGKPSFSWDQFSVTTVGLSGHINKAVGLRLPFNPHNTVGTRVMACHRQKQPSTNEQGNSRSLSQWPWGLWKWWP